jgi:hypothetical protein
VLRNGGVLRQRETQTDDGKGKHGRSVSGAPVGEITVMLRGGRKGR